MTDKQSPKDRFTWNKGDATYTPPPAPPEPDKAMTTHQDRDEYPNPWRIHVRGHPARRESIAWREALRDAVLDAYPQAPFPPPPAQTKFSVEVIFRMTREDLAKPAIDLDNFAKPILDTLFTSQNVTRLTGVLLPAVNDTWVFRLHLEKVQVETPDEQGADITVAWHEAGTPDLTHLAGD